MHAWVVVLAVALATTTTNALQYHGILMNGAHGGTQVYDPFNAPHAQGNLQLGLQPRDYAQGGAAVINGQLAYFASGLDGTLFVEYNTATNTTRTLASIPQWRRWYGMAILIDSGNVLVCGGANTNEAFLSTCAAYNTAANAWTTTAFASLPVAIANFPMVILNSRPYVFGGWGGELDPLNTVYTFDVGTNVWTGRASMQSPLAWHSAVATLNNTSAHVCGGLTTGDASSVQSSCYTYSSSGDLWTLVTSMNTARLGHGMAVYKGRVLVYGGQDVNGAMLASVEMLSLDGSAWHTQPTSMFKADTIFASVPLSA